MFWRKKKKKHQINEVTASGSIEPYVLKVVVKTDLGNVRTNNEDAGSFVKMNDDIKIREKGYLLLVADGMGGHNAGEVASRMAVDIITEEYFKQDAHPDKEKALARAFHAANKKIYDRAASNDSCKGMGTTCTALVVAGESIYYAHAGDSRAYLLKKQEIKQITEDHTYVQELVKKGDITPEQAADHPQRNILTNAMGTKPLVKVDAGLYDLSFDLADRLLVCSDGLYDYFNDAEIGQAMQYESLQQSADFLVAEAKRRGGKDNITVVLAEKMHPDNNGNALKLTRDVDLLKMTRDADLPPAI
jgi:PPM family protein phosphatase